MKNFKPLRFCGRWLAVIITAPSKSQPGSTVAINMAGVLAIPQSAAVAPMATSPVSTARCREGPESRLSRPTATFSSAMGLPQRSASHAAYARAICPAASSVRVTGSAATSGSATPRTSLPFCSLL